MMNISALLSEMADEELKRMAAVPWASYAKLIHERTPRSAGETYGCEVEGVCFDVGVGAAWEDEVDGNIVLTTFATTDQDGRQRVERSTVIPKD